MPLNSESDSLSPTPIGSVRLATTDREKEQIYRLRYKIYIEEMCGEKRHPEADNRTQQFRDHWDERAYHFYIEHDGAIVASLRLNLRSDGPLECEEHFDIEQFRPSFPGHVGMISRLVLHPNFRGSLFLKQVAFATYQHALEKDMHYYFIDCHPKLLPLYSRLGYRIYRPGFNHQKYTYVIPMVLAINDVGYLDQIKSPLVSVARQFGFSSSMKGHSIFWQRPPSADAADCSDSRTGQLAITSYRPIFDWPATLGGVELFEGLTPDEIRTVVSGGHVVTCRTGDRVLNPGERGQELFVIVSGSFQGYRRTPSPCAGDGKSFKILATGEVFGEIRFLKQELHYDSIKAREDSTLLIIHGRSLDRLITTDPTLSAKIFRNIARIVAKHLCDGVRFLRISTGRVSKPAPWQTPDLNPDENIGLSVL
ncbi:MAG TPA: GNAT family N-acetyltransferase [Nitrospirales bacterium]